MTEKISFGGYKIKFMCFDKQVRDLFSRKLNHFSSRFHSEAKLLQIEAIKSKSSDGLTVKPRRALFYFQLFNLNLETAEDCMGLVGIEVA